jgi:hypothetical protein
MMKDESGINSPDSSFILHRFLLPLIEALSSLMIILGRAIDGRSARGIHFDDLGANRLIGCPGRNCAFGHQDAVLVGLDAH